MTKVYFEHGIFCMFCGMSDITTGWQCHECEHEICNNCLESMKAVGKEPYCVWWNCKSNTHIRITAAEQFEKPVIVQDYGKYEGQIVASQHIYVEINVEGKWRPIDVLGFHSNTDRDAPRISSGLRRMELSRRELGRPVTYAEFTIPIDTKTFEYLAEGTLVRAAYLMPDGSHAVLFQGFIREGKPDLEVKATSIPLMTVHCIDGIPPKPEEPPKEHHYLNLSPPDLESIERHKWTGSD